MPPDTLIKKRFTQVFLTFFFQKRIFLHIFPLNMRIILRKIILGIMINGLAIWAATEVFSSFTLQSSPSWMGFVVVGTTFGLLNTFVKPLLKLISLPFVIISMGLFLFIINALMVWLIEWIFTEALASLAIRVNIAGGFLDYVLIGLFLGVINAFFHWLLKR